MTFFPAVSTLEATRSDLRTRLHTSLHHLVFEAGAGVAPEGLSPARLSDLTLNADPFPAPVVFAGHAAILKAAQGGDRDGFRAACTTLLDAAPQGTAAPEALTILPFSPEALTPAGEALLRAAFLDDVGLMTHLDAPPPVLINAARRTLGEALDTLHRAAPDWHADLAALVSQILLAVPGAGSTGHFGGASSFDAFGALIFNAEALTSPARALMSVVHESAHLRMFLYHLDDAVLLNDGEARYASPLRREPRPMEGIFHAAWVSARMVAAARVVCASPLAPDWADDLAQQSEAARKAFDDCLPVLTEHALFSPFGQTLFTDARKAMDAD
ncbi:aKG-HExxH-type peptide beta-hydroxylase [Tropicibacter sp. S64]|uniref:aKG-HExxH-type peptide beta-hydroxylase n=1 Tax=Tropicibacter sp. S64 TaxID=3415122 RepID=UPI003C7C48B7